MFESFVYLFVISIFITIPVGYYFKEKFYLPYRPLTFLRLLHASRSAIYFLFFFVIECIILNRCAFDGTGLCGVEYYKSLCACEEGITAECWGNLLKVNVCDNFFFLCKDLAYETPFSSCEPCRMACGVYNCDRLKCEIITTNQYVAVGCMLLYNLLSLLNFYLTDREVLKASSPQSQQQSTFRSQEMINFQQQREGEGEEEEGVGEGEIDIVSEGEEEGLASESSVPWRKSEFLFLYITCCANVFFSFSLSTGFLGNPGACGGPLFSEELDEIFEDVLVLLWIFLTWVFVIFFFVIHNLDVSWRKESSYNSSLITSILTLTRRGLVLGVIVLWVYNTIKWGSECEEVKGLEDGYGCAEI